MRKVFIDVGGHWGQTIHQFYTEIKDASEWKIYSFEPAQFDSLVSSVKKYNNVECIKAAVLNFTGKVKMYPARNDGQGNATEVGKFTGDIDYENSIEVNCIDFVGWFKENIQPDDFVLIKMNIEGGEYALMPELLEVMPQVACLYIKLHHNKFNEPQKSKMLQIYNDFKLEIQKYKTFVFCDISENQYKFKWILAQS